MKYTYYITDVFTNQAFNGAQVAVFPHAEGLDKLQMSLIARELNLTETVFLSKKNDEENHFVMKMFSPSGEIDTAGHPIIAAAYTLASCNKLKPLDDNHTPVVLHQNAGEIEANITFVDNKPSFVQYRRTVSPTVDYFTPTETELSTILGIDPAYIDNKKYSSRLVCCGTPYLVVPTYYYETLRDARFNFAAWSQSIAPQTAAQEILLVSPRTPSNDSDFAVRLVGPNIAFNEDPPAGSTIPTLAAFLCSFEHMRTGTYTFSVQRGDEKTRRSIINLEMDHKGEDTLNLRVGGKAVMVCEGQFSFN